VFFHGNSPDFVFAFTKITTERSGLLNPDLIKRVVNIEVSCVNSVTLFRKRTIPTERRPLVNEVSADRGCRVVSVTDPTAVNLGFLDPKSLVFISQDITYWRNARILFMSC
jgi:hypothetical protein